VPANTIRRQSRPMFALVPEMMKRKIAEANVQQGFMLSAVLQLCRDFPRTKILCVGSYEDTAYEALRKIGVSVDGIDPNANGVDLEKFVSSNPEKKGTFDIVFSTSVLEHVPDDEGFVADAASLIAPGGYGIFTCDFKDTWNTRDPIPQADCRLYRSDDLNAGLLQAMPHCQHFDRPNWHGFEPDLQLRRRGIRVEVAATAQTLGTGLKGAANEVIDLVALFETFEPMKPGD
jgi:SAM-dependent methyltransferase